MYTDKDVQEKMLWHVRSNFRTAKDAAEHYGVSPQMISAVCTGVKPPTKAMCEDLGVRKIKVYVDK